MAYNSQKSKETFTKQCAGRGGAEKVAINVTFGKSAENMEINLEQGVSAK